MGGRAIERANEEVLALAEEETPPLPYFIRQGARSIPKKQGIRIACESIPYGEELIPYHDSLSQIRFDS